MNRSLEDYESGSSIETDIAVIGAGAAGITIARELSGSAREVLLVESGGTAFDASTQELYQGRSVGTEYHPLDVSRLRYFGGTTNHWDGHCRPLDAIDFTRRDWVPHSGWPITREELDPFYERAQEICELGPHRYEAEDWPELSSKLLDFAPAKLLNRLWQFGPPTRFGPAYGEAIEEASNVDVLLHANLADVTLDDDGNRVTSATLKTLGGKTVTLRPRVMVLACGGIENARLLLSFNRQHKAGLGNGHDLVGRYFMEHPHALAAYAVREDGPLERFVAYYGSVNIRGTVIRAKPGISEAVQKRYGILNGCLDLGYGYDRSEGYLALRHLGKAIADGRLPDDFGAAALDVLTDLGGVASGVYRRLGDERVLWFATTFEQQPNPDSRITLGDDRDALGMRQPVLDWRLSSLEKDSVRVACRLVGEELARLGIARMRIDDWVMDDSLVWRDIEGRYHHMGTTRMADSPREGVVDRNSRVHGIGNLYVTGSSVFPTSGYANATLTIVAMAARLAHYLKELETENDPNTSRLMPTSAGGLSPSLAE